ncbi:hypothetical protein THASP1DRAFT_31746 [Thamnocephalis sphaerospora]|uniref:Uncharacterized protein n=1 Tax=Thamnocephalis sphaerospora TaxID=78915 RepID=A0A4P9XKU5_9FUNG|nr:hypothetical protein THASP1DRAFT_31746 [Thamnocephalis sphaerospora]|eukprot:RKP06444.1 hypothetical protein THASP1DRAFT_31746 [Thamnocephalis sphaerospora]
MSSSSSPSASAFVRTRATLPEYTFDPLALNHILDPDNRDNRERVKRFMIERRELYTPRFDIPLDQERDLAYERLRNIGEAGFISVLDFETNPLNIFAGKWRYAMQHHQPVRTNPIRSA